MKKMLSRIRRTARRCYKKAFASCRAGANWWYTTFPLMVRRANQVCDKLGRGIASMMFLAIVLHVVEFFYPEFSTRFPVIHAYCDGFLVLGEFALKAALGFFYAIITRNIPSYWNNYMEGFTDLLRRFVEWLSSISF